MAQFIVRPIQLQQLHAAAQLVATVYSRGDNQLYASIYRSWTDSMPRYPNFDIRDFRAAFTEDGLLVSLARVEEVLLHYGQTAIKVALISAVCTHEAYRGQGYSAAVIRDILTHAAEQGMHMALLHGIRDYYDKFGFIPVWPKYTLQAPVTEALDLPQTLDVRKAARQHLPDMARLYNRHWGGRVTFSRTPALWIWRLALGYGTAVVVVDEYEAVQGYIWHDDNLSARTEVVADTPQAAATLFAYDAQRWQTNEREHLQWSVPPDDIIIPYAQLLLPITLSAQYYHSGGWMGRIIDSAALVHVLLPEIRKQARNMSSDFDPDNLIFNLHSDSVEVGLNNVRDSLCRLSLRDFVQVLFGSLRPMTLALRQPLSNESIRLLELLFPPRVASIAAWDWS